MWYEVKKPGRKKEDTQWYPLQELETQFKPYVMKLVKNYDEKCKARTEWRTCHLQRQGHHL